MSTAKAKWLAPKKLKLRIPPNPKSNSGLNQRGGTYTISDPRNHPPPDDPTCFVSFPGCSDDQPRWTPQELEDINDREVPDPIHFVGKIYTGENDHIEYIRRFQPGDEGVTHVTGPSIGRDASSFEMPEEILKQFMPWALPKVRSVNDLLVDHPPPFHSMSHMNYPPGYIFQIQSMEHSFRIARRVKRDCFLRNEYSTELSDNPFRPRSSNMQVVAVWTTFKAAVRLGDYITARNFYGFAKLEAMRANKHVEFADVVWTFVRTISKLDYKYVANDVIYFSVCAGEAFDELNYRKIAGAERKARMAYKFGAMFALHEKPLTASRDMKSHAFNCYALSLKRYGEYNMAERMYRWSLAETFPENKFPVPVPQDKFTYINNLIQVQLAKKMSKKNLCKHNAVSMQDQRDDRQQRWMKNVNMPSNEHVCANCVKLFSAQKGQGLCSQCKLARYCSAKCQKEHWPRHKKECRLVAKEKRTQRKVKQKTKKEENEGGNGKNVLPGKECSDRDAAAAKLGVRVRLCGLKKQSFNGKTGVRGEWYEKVGRFAILLDDGGSTIKVKPANLETI